MVVERPAVSVVVVSHGRPAELRLCLTALRQQDLRPFEIVVVADAAGCAAIPHDLRPGIKVIAFDAANIARARNLGIAAAAGDVVAFVDDDAVPEPTWLGRLTAPFMDPAVHAAGGFVRGRNGISFQWQARMTDRTGAALPVPVDAGAVSLHASAPDRVMRTEGTNCAFRRAAIVRIGGFDPAFLFYLDDTDVSLRLAALGGLTAIVPLAQVQHGFAAGPHRRADRVPRSLHEVGASTAVFLRKHADPADLAPALDRTRSARRRQLLALMVSGAVEPGQVGALMTTLEKGITDGLARDLARYPAAVPPVTDSRTEASHSGARHGASEFSDPPPFLAVPWPVRAGHLVLAGRVWSARKWRAVAARSVDDGHAATLFLFSPTALRHRMRFDPRGFWEQRGGLFGAATRDSAPFRIIGFRARVRLEVARIAPVRGQMWPEPDD